MKKFDVTSFLISVILCGLWGFFGNLLADMIPNKILAMGVFFGGLAVLTFVAIVLSNTLRRMDAPSAKNYAKAAGFMAATVILACVGQFVYSQNISVRQTVVEETVPETEPAPELGAVYFLVDDSGSMEQTGGLKSDPTRKRVEAVKQIVSMPVNENRMFAMYTFKGTEDSVIRKMSLTVGKEAAHYPIDVDGGAGSTNFGIACSKVIEDILAAKNIPANESPEIVLLTDGVNQGDKNGEKMAEAVKKAVANNIVIHTVGLGKNVDEENLREIAQETGGKFVMVDEASDLFEAFETVVVTEPEIVKEEINIEPETEGRTLLNYREPVEMDWLYGVAHTFILLAIGACFFGIKAQLLRTRRMDNGLLNPNIVPIAVGAVSPELIINLIQFIPSAAVVLLSVGFGCLINIMDPMSDDLEEGNAFVPSSKRFR